MDAQSVDLNQLDFRLRHFQLHLQELQYNFIKHRGAGMFHKHVRMVSDGIEARTSKHRTKVAFEYVDLLFSALIVSSCSSLSLWCMHIPSFCVKTGEF